MDFAKNLLSLEIFIVDYLTCCHLNEFMGHSCSIIKPQHKTLTLKVFVFGGKHGIELKLKPVTLNIM